MNNKIKENGPNTYEPLSSIKFWSKGAGLYEVYINGVNAGLFDEDDYEKLHSLEETFLDGLNKLLEPTIKSRKSESIKDNSDEDKLNEHCGGANFDTSCSSKLGRCHTNYSSRRQSHVSSSQPPSGRYKNKVDLRFPRRIEGVVYHSEDELRYRLFELLEAVNSLDNNVEKYSTQMLLDLAYSKRLITEEVKLNEARSGSITVISPSGHRLTYPRKEIKEMIDQYYEIYECADNLPKWVWVSAYYHNAENVRKYLRKYKGNKNEKVIGLLKDLLICKRATIDLDLSRSNSFNQSIDIEM